MTVFVARVLAMWPDEVAAMGWLFLVRLAMLESDRRYSGSWQSVLCRPVLECLAN